MGLDHRFKTIFYKMKNRCNNINDAAYCNYGGRGIKCLRNTTLDFYNDMRDSYVEHCKNFGEKNTTIDRINNDGDYCKENCRWATKKEQANNKRSNLSVIIEGKEYNIRDYIREFSVSYDTAKYRMREYNKGDLSYETLIHKGSTNLNARNRGKGVFINDVRVSMKELILLTGGLPRSTISNRIKSYEKGILSEEELLRPKENLDNGFRAGEAIYINGKLINCGELSRELGISRTSASERIKRYLNGDICAEAVFFKGRVTKRINKLLQQNKQQGVENQRQ